MKKEDVDKIKDIIEVWNLEQADESLQIIIYKEDIESLKRMIEVLDEDKEIINKMAKRLKAFERKHF